MEETYGERQMRNEDKEATRNAHAAGMLSASGAVAELMDQGMDLISSQLQVGIWLKEIEEMDRAVKEWRKRNEG
jgi:hypothetical protein